ncbi:MAG: DUF2141 domain-containing protein [Bacteroidales bacterium]
MTPTFFKSLALSLLILPLTGVRAQTAASPAAKARLEIRFSGLRTDQGSISAGMCRTEEGWPRKPQRNFVWKKSRVRDGVFTVVIDNLSYGTYAFTCLDDENENGDIDMLLGVPREGWGFSGNPPFRLSAPGFEECAFVIDRPEQTITIELNYVRKNK